MERNTQPRLEGKSEREGENSAYSPLGEFFRRSPATRYVLEP